MFWSTEASISCNYLSAAASCEHADPVSSPTHLLMMGMGEKLGEPKRYSSNAPRPMVLEDMGLGLYHLGQYSRKH
jgi:hypothetical protein